MWFVSALRHALKELHQKHWTFLRWINVRQCWGCVCMHVCMVYVCMYGSAVDVSVSNIVSVSGARRIVNASFNCSLRVSGILPSTISTSPKAEMLQIDMADSEIKALRVKVWTPSLHSCSYSRNHPRSHYPHWSLLHPHSQFFHPHLHRYLDPHLRSHPPLTPPHALPPPWPHPLL